LPLAPALLLPSVPPLASALSALVSASRLTFALFFSPNFLLPFFANCVLLYRLCCVPICVSLASFALSPDRSAITVRHMRLPTARCHC
jgi:hypothetical protein